MRVSSLLALLPLLLPLSASAQAPRLPDASELTDAPPPATDPAQAALRASQVLDAHCAEVAAGTATKSAQALSAVSPALTEVSAAHDATGEA